MSRHLHFTQSLEPLQGGGLGTSTFTLHRQMLAAGVESRLCATCGASAEARGEGTFEFSRVGPDFLYFSPQLVLRASDLVSETDIVHGHGLYVGTNYIFGRAARRQRKPLVYHVHGMFEPYILRRSLWKKRLVHWLFEDANVRHVSLWRALTVKEADQIRDCGIQGPIIVAPNGLDLNMWPPRSAENSNNELPTAPILRKSRSRLLFLGRLHPKKGLDLLLSAWSSLKQHWKDWELVIAGPDEQGHQAILQKLAQSLGLRDSVSFIGPVTGTIKILLVQSADLFVLPSYSEGFPMSLLEALACSVPVVATRACNFAEITSAEAGWECDSDADALLVSLRQAFQASDAERAERGRNGRRLVEQRYTWPLILDVLLTACSKLG